ncbi:MAG: transcriptional regulator NrdR [Phycisphaeraceae bacterium]|nr:transcriptional regulator NrdR [Phycisphaeraceae bacterium]
MRCPACQHEESKVIDSRSAEDGASIRRRRECMRCSRRFTTYERMELQARLVVVKKDGSRTPFDGSKILGGIRAACGKRPISESDKEQIVQRVEQEIVRDFDREVPSVEIGRRVAAHLRELDEIAYVRFASEYFKFSSLDELQKEVEELQSRPKPLPNQVPLFGDGPRPGGSRE